MTIDQLEQRIVALERELYKARLRLAGTWLTDLSPLKRSLAVLGHCLFAGCFLAVALGAVSLLLVLILSFAFTLAG